MAKSTSMKSFTAQQRDAVLANDRLYPQSQVQLQARFKSGKIDAHVFRNTHTWLVLSACRRADLSVSHSRKLATA